MDIKEEIKTELGELAPKLSRMERQNPFRLPEYYFQRLPDNMLEMIKAQPVTWTEKLEIWLNYFFALIFHPRYAISASAFLLALIVGIGFLKSGKNNDAEISRQLSELPANEIKDYVLENIDDDELAALSGIFNDFIPEDIATEELENYFQNNSENQSLEEEIL